MASSQQIFEPTYVTEIAIGDGNCAFNAFILGLAEEVLIKQLPEADADRRYQAFIERARHLFPDRTPVTWALIRDRLITHKSQAKTRHQVQLDFAPIMRALAIDLMEENFEATFSMTQIPLTDELASYFRLKTEDPARNITELTPTMGDIFIRHPFLKNEFDSLWKVWGSTEGGLLAAQDKLSADWHKEGLRVFLEAMRSDGQHAGDLELKMLAMYFGIALKISMHDGSVHCINFPSMQERLVKADGTELTLDRAICMKLSSRGIIDMQRVLEPISTAEEVAIRLGAIPEYETVAAYIETQQPIKGSKYLLRGALPVKINCASVELCGLTKETMFFCSHLNDAFVEAANNGKDNRKVTLERIAAFPNAEIILAAWLSSPRYPTMRLSNPRASHWDNMVEARQAPAAMQLSTAVALSLLVQQPTAPAHSFVPTAKVTPPVSPLLRPAPHPSLKKKNLKKRNRLNHLEQSLPAFFLARTVEAKRDVVAKVLAARYALETCASRSFDVKKSQ